MRCTRARVRRGAYAKALRETARGLRLVTERDDAAAVAARAMLRAWRSEIRMSTDVHVGDPTRPGGDDEAQATDELEALAHAYTALDGAYQLLGQPETRCTSAWRSTSTRAWET